MRSRQRERERESVSQDIVEAVQIEMRPSEPTGRTCWAPVPPVYVSDCLSLEVTGRLWIPRCCCCCLCENRQLPVAFVQ